MSPHGGVAREIPRTVSKRRKACSRLEIMSSVNVSIEVLSAAAGAAVDVEGTTRDLRDNMVAG